MKTFNSSVISSGAEWGGGGGGGGLRSLCRELNSRTRSKQRLSNKNQGERELASYVNKHSVLARARARAHTHTHTHTNMHAARADTYARTRARADKT